MKRAAIFSFTDEAGIVDAYVNTLLVKLRPFVERIIFVANGCLSASGRSLVKPLVEDVIVRDLKGFDAWAYKEGLELIGFDEIASYDEVLFLDSSFFGPVFPFSELFGEMDARDCDFWGVTARNSGVVSPLDHKTQLPFHLKAQFVAVRATMLSSSMFKTYWSTLPLYERYEEFLCDFEGEFTSRFTGGGFVATVYTDCSRYDSPDPTIAYVSDLMARRCPVFSRELLLMSPSILERDAVDVRGALQTIEESSDYDVDLIWANIARTSKARTINTNATLLNIFPDLTTYTAEDVADVGKVAVCVHMYYVDMVEEILALAMNIPVPFDFLATTDTEAKKREIEQAVSGRKGIDKVIVRVMEQNRGRDMSALFICFRDLFLTDEYSLVCRLHTKKTPQVDASRGKLFKDHMFENVLNSPGFVTNVLHMFKHNPRIGVATPPLVHISFPTLGHSWFVNKPKVMEMAREFGLKIPLDDHTPVAAYGTMFWFRPKALRPLFAREWKFTDFNAEPHHVDGGLAHVLERMICYVAQDQGYLTRHLMCTEQAESNYTWLEYKFAELMSHMPYGDLRISAWQLADWRANDYKIHEAPTKPSKAFRAFVRAVRHSIKRSIRRIAGIR